MDGNRILVHEGGVSEREWLGLKTSEASGGPSTSMQTGPIVHNQSYDERRLKLSQSNKVA